MRKAADTTAPLLRRLRVKFVALSMAVVTLALALSFSAICYLNYQQGVADVYDSLRQSAALAATNADRRDAWRPLDKPPLFSDGRGTLGDGVVGSGDAADAEATSRWEGQHEDARADAADDAASGSDTAAGPDATPGADPGGEPDGAPDEHDPAADETAPAPEDPGSAVPDDASSGQDDPVSPQAPEIGGDGNAGSLIPMAVCHLDDDGTLALLPRYTTASVSPDLLAQALEEALASRESSGYLPDVSLFFSYRTSPAGLFIAFADQSAASSWQGLAITLAGVGVVALLGFLAVSVLFARWALRPVERAWSQQQQFIADASHELKTPLTVILANLAIVRGHGSEPVASQAQWLESTETEARRMQGLVGDMLDLARTPDPTVLRASFAPVDLSDLAEGEALQFESVAFDREVTIDCHLEPSVRVEGDAARLQRLVGALIDNACKYAAPRTAVDVRVAGEGREAVLSVANHGALIAPEDLAHVFDRFFRADKARTRALADEGASASGGYGLGLAIAQGIAHEHGGAITAASAPEAPGSPSGVTTFTVRLPRID